VNRRSLAIVLIGMIAAIAGSWTATRFGVIAGLVVGALLGAMLFRILLFASGRTSGRG
jgi:hypothetical protein